VKSDKKTRKTLEKLSGTVFSLSAELALSRGEAEEAEEESYGGVENLR
jgi:hypothetical protein